MVTLGPYLMLIVLVVGLCLWFLYAAMESFRHDLMAKNRLLFLIIVMVGVLGLIVFYFLYVLGGPITVPTPAAGS